MKTTVALLIVLLLAACSEESDLGAMSPTSTTATAVSSTEASTATVPPAETITNGVPTSVSLAPPEATEVIIEGTRTPYTFDETQAFDEFGPLLWHLVTTINGTDDIPHGPGHEWVTWGPLWAGRLSVSGPHDVFGVTDLTAVDVEAIAAVVPVGTTIAFREVRWSLDELEQFAHELGAGAPDNGVCSTGSGGYVNRIKVVATEPVSLGGVPPDAVAIEVVDECPLYVRPITTIP